MGAVLGNPLANPLFGPTVATVGAVLAGALPLLCLAERRHLRDLRQSVLLRRWLSWLLIAPIYGLAILAGPATTGLLVACLVAVGLREYGGLVQLPLLHTRLLVGAGLVVVGAAAVSPQAFLAVLPPLLLLATLPALLAQDVASGTRHLAFWALGLVYLPVWLAHLLLVQREVAGGTGILLALGLAVAFSDVGAFLAGRAFGRRKLAPRLSPNKTWAGAAGSLVGAALALALMQFAFPDDRRPLLLLVLPLVVAVGAAWGDLLESLMKREFGVKDTGTLLPGMGGVLDRLDSLIVVAPLAYYVLLLAA